MESLPNIKELIERIDKQELQIKQLTILNEQNKKKITRLAKVVDNNTDIFEKEIDNLTFKIEIMQKETIKATKAIKRKRSDEDDVAKGAGGALDVKSSKKEKKKTANEIRDEYISRLINGRKKSKPWSIGMSKYGSITYMEGSLKKWLWQSAIFDEPNQNFETKEEAESYFEQILKKYNIPVEYIIRRNYDASKDAGVGAGAGTGEELYEDDEVIEEDCYEDE